MEPGTLVVWWVWHVVVSSILFLFLCITVVVGCDVGPFYLMSMQFRCMHTNNYTSCLKVGFGVTNYWTWRKELWWCIVVCTRHQILVGFCSCGGYGVHGWRLEPTPQNPIYQSDRDERRGLVHAFQAPLANRRRTIRRKVF